MNQKETPGFNKRMMRIDDDGAGSSMGSIVSPHAKDSNHGFIAEDEEEKQPKK